MDSKISGPVQLSAPTELEQARTTIQSVRGTELSTPERAQKAVDLASLLLSAASSVRTRADKQQEQRLSRLMDDQRGEQHRQDMPGSRAWGEQGLNRLRPTLNTRWQQ